MENAPAGIDDSDERPVIEEDGCRMPTMIQPPSTTD